MASQVAIWKYIQLSAYNYLKFPVSTCKYQTLKKQEMKEEEKKANLISKRKLKISNAPKRFLNNLNFVSEPTK